MGVVVALLLQSSFFTVDADELVVLHMGSIAIIEEDGIGIGISVLSSSSSLLLLLNGRHRSLKQIHNVVRIRIPVTS